ncbi:interleukin-10 receptor subunit beta-like isoform X2 [Sander vitreus]
MGYKVVCVNISTLECDLTDLKLFQYGRYTGRVRVQLGTESSAWVESNQIALDRDTIIGAPNVSLFSNGATIEVSIKDPVFRISSFRGVYNLATYNITYWKDGQKEKNQSISNMLQNRVVLINLDPWTKYCVQVQISTERHPNPKPNHTVPSAVVCESTTIEEEAPWVAAMVTFVVMTMAVAVVVVAVVYRKRISHFLCPKDALPEHFKEYLLAHPNYLDMQNSYPPKEIFDPVSIIADGSTLEEGLHLEAAGTSCSQQPDTT